MEGEKGVAEEGVGRVRDGAEKRVRVMKDMLSFERDRLAGCEREWRSTKKVLVKEVKSCRLRIMALEAERDGFWEENLRLKEAIRLIGLGRNSSNGKDKR